MLIMVVVIKRAKCTPNTSLTHNSQSALFFLPQISKPKCTQNALNGFQKYICNDMNEAKVRADFPLCFCKSGST